MKSSEIIKIFKALGNDRRFAIMGHLLEKGELNVTAISELISLSIKSVSRHLSVLKNAGLVRSRQENINVFYSLDQDQSKEFSKFLK